MKQLLVPNIFHPDDHVDLSQISRKLDSQNRHAIDVVPWSAWSYKPDVAFSIAHRDQSIFLKYYVTEKETKTAYSQTNDPVYIDSCVEFFVSFNNGAAYYNLEFNSKGVCLAGYGVGREERELLPVELIEQIERLSVNHPVIGNQNNKWELCLCIPIEVFCYDQLDALTGKTVNANFYKCGDGLAHPHFLAWNPIISNEPNFHMPEYFGELTFAPNTNTLN